MPELLILKQLGVIVLLAGLIGLEREKKYQAVGNADNFGGLRTFVLAGVLGVLAYVAGERVPYLFLAFALGFFALVVASYWVTAKNFKDKGSTSELGAMLVFLIGIFVGMETYLVATAVTLFVFVVLHFKERLHFLVSRVQTFEIISAVQFAIIAFVVLPILPNQGFGPYEVFNPYLIWLMVVLISGISFVSYVAIKILGTRLGIGMAGFLAGLISSTALSLSFATQSKRNPKVVNPYVFAIVVANTAMVLRVLLTASLVSQKLFFYLLLPIVVMALAGISASFFFFFRRDPFVSVKKNMDNDVLKIQSPFNLKPALQFAFLFSGILLFAEWMGDLFGDRGLYLTAILAGLVDVDAITVSTATLVNESLVPQVATVAIILAVVANTLVKIFIFFFGGGRAVALRIAGAMLFMVFCGIIASLAS